jgi:prepilin-type N-terminal cleavage/methylation domain-containing protein
MKLEPGSGADALKMAHPDHASERGSATRSNMRKPVAQTRSVIIPFLNFGGSATRAPFEVGKPFQKKGLVSGCARSPVAAVRRPTAARRLAFTLLEILVAVALLSMVVAAIYACWNSIIKGSKTALRVAENAQRERIVMRTLHDSLLCACLFNSPGTNLVYNFLAESDSDNSTVSFVARLPGNFLRHGKFGDFDVRRVEFKVEPTSGRSKRLVMRQRLLMTDFDKDELEYPIVLTTNLNRFLVEFVDPKTGDWITDWELTNQLPKEMRITLALGHGDQFTDKADEAIVDVVAPPSVAWQVPQVGTGATGLNLGGGAGGPAPAPGGKSRNGGVTPQ